MSQTWRLLNVRQRAFWLIPVAVTLVVLRFVLLSEHAVALTAGIAGFCVLALLPFRRVVTIAVVASAFTFAVVPVGGTHLRLEQLVVPAAVVACVTQGHTSKLTGALRHPVLRCLAAFIAYQFLISALRSPDAGQSFSIALWFTSNLVVLALGMAAFTRGELRSRLYLGAWLIVTTGIVSRFAPGVLGAVTAADLTSADGIRAKGISLEPNILAGVAAVWLVILLTSGRKLRARDWVFIAMAAAVIPLSLTRSGLIAVAVGVGIYALRSVVTSVRVVLIAAIGAVVLTIVGSGGVLASAASKFANLGFNNDTADHRFYIYRMAFADLSDWHWVFGLGTNSFGQRHLEPTDLTRQTAAYLGNLPLQTLYDEGVPGVLLLALAAVLVIRSSSSRARVAAVGAAFLMVASATSPFFFAYYWLLIAAVLAVDTRRSEDSSHSSARNEMEDRSIGLVPLA